MKNVVHLFAGLIKMGEKSECCTIHRARGRVLLTLLVCTVCMVVYYTSWALPTVGYGPKDQKMVYSRPGTSYRIANFLRDTFLKVHNSMKTKPIGSLTQMLMENKLPVDFQEFFKAMVVLEGEEWAHNFTSVQRYRQELSEFAQLDDLRSRLITTKDSKKPGDYVKCYKSITDVKVTDELWQMLANHSIFNGKRVKRCNIVGSGGILLHSKCGKRIDSGDVVFRFNLPTMLNFSEDVGIKSDYVTVNPSAVKNWLLGLYTHKNGESALQEVSLEHRGHALISAFDVSFTLEYAMHMFRVRKEQPCEESYFMNPEHLLAYRQFWLNAGLKQEISSGFYIASAALDICDEVHLYGFWPFTVATNGAKVPYHYYDELNFALYHDLPQEYRVLVRMHQMGLIKLHFGRCSYTTLLKASY